MFFNKKPQLTKDETVYVAQQFLKYKANKEQNAEKQKFDEILQQEYYAANLQNFYNTTLEKDKSILTLSSAAIGLLSSNIFFEASLVLWLVCVIAFGLAIICSLVTFVRNGSYMVDLNVDILNGTMSDHKCEKGKLRFLGYASAFLFGVGILFLLIIAYYQHQRIE